MVLKKLYVFFILLQLFESYATLYKCKGRESYIEAGFDDYLSKPINPTALEQMIADYCINDNKDIE